MGRDEPVMTRDGPVMGRDEPVPVRIHGTVVSSGWSFVGWSAVIFIVVRSVACLSFVNASMEGVVLVSYLQLGRNF